MTWQDLLRRFGRVLRPTLAQALGAIFLALATLTLAQTQSIFARLGISQEAVTATHNQVLMRFGVILESSITANVALVTFWATVGLIAYLVCWGLYNVIIEARNEVTLETQYMNRGHWHGAVETLALKAVAGVILMLYVGAFKYGLSLWLALASAPLDDLSTMSVLMAVLGVLGFASQLYGLLVLVQLTITPWYRKKAFTA
ncbi:MAG TPA: hypothetical protein VLI05_06465 [Candidatus Saccharimonadia bacterium]|nr:hypothetical protein [Candidatus Saccharimonadia bacterium]